jgi:hypothetical protein
MTSHLKCPMEFHPFEMVLTASARHFWSLRVGLLFHPRALPLYSCQLRSLSVNSTRPHYRARHACECHAKLFLALQPFTLQPSLLLAARQLLNLAALSTSSLIFNTIQTYDETSTRQIASYRTTAYVCSRTWVLPLTVGYQTQLHGPVDPRCHHLVHKPRHVGRARTIPRRNDPIWNVTRGGGVAIPTVLFRTNDQYPHIR